MQQLAIIRNGIVTNKMAIEDDAMLVPFTSNQVVNNFDLYDVAQGTFSANPNVAALTTMRRTMSLVIRDLQSAKDGTDLATKLKAASDANPIGAVLPATLTISSGLLFKKVYADFKGPLFPQKGTVQKVMKIAKWLIPAAAVIGGWLYFR